MTWTDFLKTAHAQNLAAQGWTEEGLRQAWKGRNRTRRPKTVHLQEWRPWSEWR